MKKNQSNHDSEFRTYPFSAHSGSTTALLEPFDHLLDCIATVLFWNPIQLLVMLSRIYVISCTVNRYVHYPTNRTSITSKRDNKSFIEYVDDGN